MKYDRLREHLENLERDRLTLSFAELERILRVPLPPSARRYPAWWANQSGGAHSHSKAWLEAGWRARNLSLHGEKVTFIREGVSDQKPRHEGATRRSRTQGSKAPVGRQTSKDRAVRSKSRSITIPVIALVACAKTKAPHPAKAKDLYVSPLFQKARDYVEENGWQWYILSAQHGLVNPEDVLAPYERTLVGRKRAERQEWAQQVNERLETTLPREARIVLLAGARYCEFIVPALLARGYHVERPLKGLSLGRQLAYYGSDSKGASTSSGSRSRAASGAKRRAVQPGLVDELSPLHREHYEVARTFEGFFARSAFLARYRQLYPGRNRASVIPSDYCFNRENKGNARHPRFLWWDGNSSYVFVGLHGAPEDFIKQDQFLPTSRSFIPRRPESSKPKRRQVGNLRRDLNRASELADILYRAFLPSGPGVFDKHEMPEDWLPVGLIEGSKEQLLFVTLTVSIDYMRDADQLWKAAREAFADPETSYLFDPEKVVEAGFEKTRADLQEVELSKKPIRDARAWFLISETLHSKWRGNLSSFLKDCDFHAPEVLRRLGADSHVGELGAGPDFPHLKGKKIGPLWIRILRDNGGIEFSGLEEVDIPVDVHVLRATLCSGAITGQFEGNQIVIFEQVRQVWKDAVKDLVCADGKQMVSLDIDEALWTLSREGCSKRGKGMLGPCSPECPAAPGCVNGVISIRTGRCTIDT